MAESAVLNLFQGARYMIHFKRTLALVTLLVLVIGVFGVTAQDETVLVIGHAEATDSLDPAHGFTQTTGIVNRATYSTLVTFPDGDASEILPMLADSWEIAEDGLAYTFALNEDATFSNGDDIDSDDVVFSIKRLQNADGNPSFLADNIADVVAVDENTVEFSLVDARPSFLTEMTNYAFSITNADLVRDNGGTDADDAAETDTAEEFLNDISAGSGPYILEAWEPQVETVLVRNENYWGEQPYFDRVIIINIPEAATQKVALEAGDIDLALDLSPDQMPSLLENSDIEVSTFAGVITHFIFMNQDSDIGGPFSDPIVQLAVRYALDYEGYITLWGGVIPGTNLTVGLQGAFSGDQAFSRDLDRAKELLAEAGYPDGLDVTLQYPDFSFQGVNMNTNAQKIQSDLAEAGINVTLEPGELQVSLDQYRTGQQGFAYWFWGPDILDPLDFLSFLPGGKVAEERLNWHMDDVDQEIQDLIAAANNESDTAARLDIFTQLQEFQQQNGPFAPFNAPGQQTAFLANIEGYVFHPSWTLDVSILSRAE
jgi:peptide/nickel transport system substrate-binding protein